MDASQVHGIVSLIWGVADDILRSFIVRGSYRDVIVGDPAYSAAWYDPEKSTGGLIGKILGGQKR